ncbi:Protease synthase and sporulation protein PAI 2 [Solibacillus isronensis B3W22]|uniref:Protease synthase and sporulation protein PAI 2 n=1 Tax=Solibacillus isronensis B3W22 TaxID=1224748 RepID=K1KQ19_9BACL|nr:FMN-binding negative transcriptional regulator [Solibacillus isronensis]AMO85593.1 transcriptional regulator [Solibacillus silvestris]EKB46235.1 Protease synthase and sporulation protein PAI 2 [Solibacillus isronensis B3W22]
MYIPKQYQLTDEQRIRQIINEYSFATVVSLHQGVPTATHLPLYLSEDGKFIYGHFARANTQWKDILDQQVLAIFNGPHSYISSSWYETKDSVPTWNYVAVHVKGFIELMEDEEEIRLSLHHLIDKYEVSNSSYDVNAVDSKYMNDLLKGIVPFKIRISSVEATAKLSQGHSKERQKLVIGELLKRNDSFDKEIAKLMTEN